MISLPEIKRTEPEHCAQLIRELRLIKHPEGGYFNETDRSPILMANPYQTEHTKPTRNSSTLIFYYLSPTSPIGKWHRNRSRIIHILQKGSGTYVLAHPEGRVESFEVGHNPGQKMQWVVEGGVYKSSFTSDPDGLLISEVVVPGFEYEDHNFMPGYDALENLVGKQLAGELKGLL